MTGVHKDDLVVFINTILIDPVRIQNAQVATTATNALLCDTPQASLELEMINALTDGLAVGST